MTVLPPLMLSVRPALARRPASMFAVPPLPTIVPLAFGGRPALQLAGLNQLPVALFQLVCARADVAASNVAAATTVVANKCVRISPPAQEAHGPT